AGGILGGVSISQEGAMVTDMETINPPQTQNDPALRPGSEQITDEKYREEQRRREEENFKNAEAAIKDAIKENPDLKELEKNLMVDMTPEGLRIQVVDQDGKPMFPSGSAQMYEKT